MFFRFKKMSDLSLLKLAFNIIRLKTFFVHFSLTLFLALWVFSPCFCSLVYLPFCAGTSLWLKNTEQGVKKLPPARPVCTSDVVAAGAGKWWIELFPHCCVAVQTQVMGLFFSCYYFPIHPLLNDCALLCLPSLVCGDSVRWQRENQNTPTEMPPPGNYRRVSAVAAFAKAAVLVVDNFWAKMVEERNWFEGHSISPHTCLKTITVFIGSSALFTLTALGLHIPVEGWQSVRRALRLLKISGKVFPGSAPIAHPLKRSSNSLSLHTRMPWKTKQSWQSWKMCMYRFCAAHANSDWVWFYSIKL